jgi:starch-binding outer membrane protein, SusD/RagB family
VNTIAINRDGSFAGYSSSGADLLSDIILERRKELAFEGHRYWDLARYNVDVERNDVNNKYSDLGAPLSIPAGNFRRIMPIPQSEIDANPTIRDQQNPGY